MDVREQELWKSLWALAVVEEGDWLVQWVALETEEKQVDSIHILKENFYSFLLSKVSSISHMLRDPSNNCQSCWKH